jgi:CsoR family transcriptional regulator, copper-sensing transcriptional repressor|tara:strand:- start:808 stop:1077 length:270 start_codon:yes stop_codon:yes gene_type:complete
MISDIKRRAVHRSKILQGQLKGIEKMIEDEEYCMDILTQSLALQKSIRSLNKLILENHLRTHIKDGMSSHPDASIEELLKLYAITDKAS